MFGEIYFNAMDSEYEDNYDMLAEVQVYDVLTGTDITVPLRPAMIPSESFEEDFFITHDKEIYMSVETEQFKALDKFINLMDKIRVKEMRNRQKIMKAVTKQTYEGMGYTSAKGELLYALGECSLTQCQYMAECFEEQLEKLLNKSEN